MKTIKAYKLFRVKEGKLYPLFVEANNEVIMGKWLKASLGEINPKTGKVKSKIGDLAFRAGWHSGDMPVATHIGKKSDASLKKPDLRPSNQVWAEVEIIAEVDYQEVVNEIGKNKKGKIIPRNACFTDRLPENGFYRYKTNSNMIGNWIISDHIKVIRVLSDDEVLEINKADQVFDLPRE